MSTFGNDEQNPQAFGRAAQSFGDSTSIGAAPSYGSGPHAAAAMDRRPNASAKLSLGISIVWILFSSLAPFMFIYAIRSNAPQWYPIVSLTLGAVAGIAALVIALKSVRQPGSALWSGAAVGIAIMVLGVLAWDALVNYVIAPYIIYPSMW